MDDATWEAARVRRAKMAATRPVGSWTKRETMVAALLAGIARCATCGAALTRRSKPHGTGPTRRRVFLYGCSSRSKLGACSNGVELREEQLDVAVLEALATALSPDAVEAAVRQAMAEAKVELAGSATKRAELDRDLRTVHGKIDKLTEAIAMGTAASGPLLVAKLAQEEERRVTLQRDRDALDVARDTID